MYDKQYYQSHKKEINANHKRDYEKNRGKRQQIHRRYYRELKQKILDHYGFECACCGVSEFEFLTIDHMNGGGNKHRKEVGSGVAFYLWLIRNNYPKGFQILCYNCNCSKGHVGYCPHQKEKK